MPYQFDEVIATTDALRAIVNRPGDRTATKEIDHIDDICRRFIAASPFVIVGTRGADGLLDLSPKGDPAGFVEVLDDKTLVIPDRPGNNRFDSYGNVLVNPEVALIFLVPGIGYSLRVGGTGRIVRDALLQQRMAVKGKAPHLLLAVHVEEAFLHCAKCMTRSALWRPDGWPDVAGLPTHAEGMVAHSSVGGTVSEMQAVIDESVAKGMY